MPKRIDAHQHFWDLDRVEYPWLGPHVAVIHRTYEPAELEPHLAATGVESTVVVQAANSLADTAYMLEQADRYPWIAGVVGWVPLLEPDVVRRALDEYGAYPKFRGVRHLIHDEADPDWVVRESVVASLRLLEERDLAFDVVAVFPNHLRHVPALAEALPRLRLVIDHLAKPPIRERRMEPWGEQMAAAARYPNVYAKVSGLNTAADPDSWSAADLKPYIDRAFDLFGADRLLFGSDWPVCELAGTYERVWEETNAALAGRSRAEIDAVLGETAQRVYGL